MTLEECRSDFELSAKRSLSMPIAGAIFPMAFLVSKITKEEVFSSKNPLAKLMGLSVLMVNLLWAIIEKKIT